MLELESIQTSGPRQTVNLMSPRGKTRRECDCMWDHVTPWTTGSPRNQKNSSFSGLTGRNCMRISVSWAQSSALDDESDPEIVQSRVSKKNLDFLDLCEFWCSTMNLVSALFWFHTFFDDLALLWLDPPLKTLQNYGGLINFRWLDLELCSIEGCHPHICVLLVVGSKLLVAQTELLVE